MTRQDYELIVKAIRDWYMNDKPGMDAATSLTAKFMKELFLENPMFDPEKFARAVFPTSKESSK